MGENRKDYKSEKIDGKNTSDTDVNSENVFSNEEDDERASLLPPPREGLSGKSEKSQQKVKWKDNYGKKLAEVLEYEPSEVSDSDDDDLDTCICTIL